MSGTHGKTYLWLNDDSSRRVEAEQAVVEGVHSRIVAMVDNIYFPGGDSDDESEPPEMTVRTESMSDRMASQFIANIG